jgi:hypothetical protein
MGATINRFTHALLIRDIGADRHACPLGIVRASAAS